MNNSEMHCSPDYHLGHVILEHSKRHADTVCQIDAATGDEETYSSVVSRSIRLARALRNYGLKPGDVVAVGGRNHLDLHIPVYAALYDGLPSVGVDPYFKYDEVRTLFNLTKPKIAFCQNEHVEVYGKAARDLGLELKIVTFDHGNCTMSEFVNKYDTDEPLDEFKVAKIDVDKVNAFLVSTSGTTGKVKVAAFNHQPFMLKWLKVLQMSRMVKGHKRTLLISPIHWISTCFTIFSTPLTGDTKIQTSKPDDFDHIVYIINKYKPRNVLMSPTLMSYLMTRKDVDLECFRSVTVTGSRIYPDVFEKFKTLLSREAVASIAYGQTEMLGPILLPNPAGPSGNCGQPLPFYDVKLIDQETQAEIKEPHVTGEMWVKGPCFTEYYQDPEETATAFTADGYFKTGDLLYRDEKNNYFYVERIKALIKYRNSHVIPIELEDIIRKHPSVKDVCVIGVSDPLDGERPVACVIKRQGMEITAQEVKDMVASKLSKNKELRGGVVFLNAFPQTSSGKLARAKLLQVVMNSKRE
ncbi:luciferin 4-monooxygenase-like [Danaus plexippus]|uniref:luciferin 4-monooxygenase-like n=1 Tax=Danaus plexippus TaxID=13037 RepID=UPI002AAFA633|nr:luciferin 4-monooxygenase-like [Danaus plexippus]